VHEGFEVFASVEPLQGVSEEGTERGTDQRRPHRARPADEKKDCSHDQADEHPLSQELLRTPRELHQSDRSTSMRP
jgi:hypothetical protein